MKKRKHKKTVLFKITTKILYENVKYSTNQLQLKAPKRGKAVQAHLFPSGRVVLCEIRATEGVK